MSKCVLCGCEINSPGCCEDCEFGDSSELDTYEQNHMNKIRRNTGLESTGKGGNKSRNKRDKKETWRKVEEKD